MPDLDETASEHPEPVDDRRRPDHPREPEPVAQPTCDQRGDDVAAGDRRQHRGRHPDRPLPQADGEVEDDERPRAGKRPLPRRVRDQEATHVTVRGEDTPRVAEIRPDALEDTRLAAGLAYEDDRHRACTDDDERRDEERRRVPDVQEPGSADQRGAERDSAEQVLHALSAAVDSLGQQVRVEPAVRRLVDVVGEEEREHEQRRRPQIGHERDESEAEPHRADRGEHERPTPAHWRVEHVAPRPDHERQRQGECTFGAENEANQARRVGESLEQSWQVRGRRRQREREAERAEPQRPDEPARRAVTRRQDRHRRCRRSSVRHARPLRRRPAAARAPSRSEAPPARRR